jgi:hypothetical protein
MSDGTPLDALESGDVANAADASRVQAILQDMNASGADTGSAAPPMVSQGQQMMPPMAQGMPPMMPPMGRQQQHYVPIEDERKPMKKNVWSTTLERIRDPLFVSLLVFALSLPVLHTFLGKYASWAFAVGGQLSWLGLIALSLLAGLLFGTYKTASDLLL